MNAFPRTTVGGVSVSRMIIGTNWFLGFSHTSAAKDRMIKQVQTRERLAEILTVFFERGIDTIMGLPNDLLESAIAEAQDRTGSNCIRVLTPHFNIRPGGPPENEPERVFDRCREKNATFCMPHQGVTDALMDLRAREIRDIDLYTKMIRERGMIPGLSTHMPETVIIADESGADVETYIQLYNAAGFLMHLEADWVMRIVSEAEKPVMTIKPLAAGRLLPPVGLAFVWNTIRDCDMVTIGTTTADEAREVIDISMDYLERRIPAGELQETRSKQSVKRM